MLRSQTQLFPYNIIFTIIVVASAAITTTASSSPSIALSPLLRYAAFATRPPYENNSRRCFARAEATKRVRATTARPYGARSRLRIDSPVDVVTIKPLGAGNGGDDFPSRSNGGTQAIRRNDVIFAKVDVPSLKIYRDVAYDVTSIYQQGFDETTGRIIKIQVESFEEPIPAGFDLFATLYNPKYHKKSDFAIVLEETKSDDGGTSPLGMVVKPEELGLLERGQGAGWVTVQDQFRESAWLALPGLFWLGLVVVMTNLYTDRYGGNIIDALLGPKYR